MSEMKSISYSRSLTICLFILVLWAQGAPAGAAEDPLHGPWNSPAYRKLVQEQKSTTRNTSMTSPFFTSLLSFFSQVISPVDGDRCPSYPTCAAYSKEAYQKHGAFLGTLMTVDRLIHEADEPSFSPTVEVHGVRRIYDPVSANEVWKRKEKRQTEAKSAQ
jgi:putative component of membrane protein insertase Oxa1/YidC/SpoIIIJ protein YidD